MAAGRFRSEGALTRLVADHVLVAGSYRPPVRVSKVAVAPPQTIICSPVQTATCELRAMGAFVRLVAVQAFVEGLNRPPVLIQGEVKPLPPQTIISVPVQTAV